MEALIISSIVLIWIVVLFNLVLTFGIARRLKNVSTTSIDPQANDRLQPGDQAPAFTVEDINGQQVSHETYAGQEVAYLFLSTSCEPCREVIPQLVKIAPMATYAGVQFVFVILDKVQDVRAFVEEFNIPSPVLVAPRLSDGSAHAFAAAYKSHSTPSYCLINGQGIVKTSGHPGIGIWKELEMVWQKQFESTIDKVPVERR